MKKTYLLFLAILFASQLLAQTGREVSGIVQDTAGAAIMGATVKLAPVGSQTDTMITRTDHDGIFIFKDVKVSQFTITVSSLGYKQVHIRSLNTVGNAPIRLSPPVILRAGALALDQVVVKSEVGVVIKQDTIEYTAADFNLKENAVAEDLIKRLDGVEVDRSGNITAQGKAVTRVRVNGKDFFGGDVNGYEKYPCQGDR